MFIPAPPKVSDRIRFADTVADIASIANKKNGEYIGTQGYSSVGDGGSNLYVYRSTGRSLITTGSGFYIAGAAADDYYEAVDKSQADIRQFGAVGDGVTDNTAVINAAITELGTKTQLIFKDGTYRIDGSITSPANVDWIFDGGIIDVQDTADVLIYGRMVNSSNQHCATLSYQADTEDSKLKVRQEGNATIVSAFQGPFSPLWFGTQAEAANDLAPLINKAYQVGGDRTVVQLPNAIHYLRSTIELNEGRLISPTLIGVRMVPLIIAANISIVGCRFSAREGIMRDVRIIEESGSRVSCCCVASGTTNIMDNCWFGNAKYGLVRIGGQGWASRNVVVESCIYGYLMGPQFYDYDIDGLGENEGGSVVVQSGQDDNMLLFNCGDSDEEECGGLYIEEWQRLSFTQDPASGTFINGETIASVENGGTATIYSTDGTRNIVYTKHSLTGTISSGDTITTVRGADEVVGGGVMTKATSNPTRNCRLSGRIYGSERHGAYIRECELSTFAITVFSNGTYQDVPTAPVYGVYVGGYAAISLTGYQAQDNFPINGNPAGQREAYGLYIDSEDAKVTLTGSIVGNAAGAQMRFACHVENGSLLSFANIYHESVFELTYSSSAVIKQFGCLGDVDIWQNATATLGTAAQGLTVSPTGIEMTGGGLTENYLFSLPRKITSKITGTISNGSVCYDLASEQPQCYAAGSWVSMGAGSPTYLLDTYTAAVAYSFRQLKTGITNVCRLRRDSDDAQSDFTAVEMLDGTAEAWAGAGNAYVHTMYDQSGNANNAVQTTNAQQPQVISSGALITENNFPAMDFTAASSQNLPIPSSVLVGEFSVFAVARRDGGGNEYLLGVVPTTEGQDLFYMRYSASIPQVFLRIDTNTANDNWSVTSVPLNMWTLHVNATTLSHKINDGTAETDDTTGLTLANFDTSRNAFIGGLNSSSPAYGNISIVELIIMDADETANEDAIRFNINDRYGIY